MPTATQRAYAKIRKSILTGKFPSGSHLGEDDIAEYCSTSRTPVRHAIAQLASEGLVTVRSNGRSYVSDMTIDHFEEMFDVMSMLESYSAGLAAKRITDHQLAELEGISAKLAEVSLGPYNEKLLLELNSQFHKAIHSASGNNKLNELVLQIVDFPHIVYLKFGDTGSSHNADSLREHEQIAKALLQGDRNHAALMMKVHTEAVRRRARELWTGKEDMPGDTGGKTRDSRNTSRR